MTQKESDCMPPFVVIILILASFGMGFMGGRSHASNTQPRMARLDSLIDDAAAVKKEATSLLQRASKLDSVHCHKEGS